MEYLVPLLAVTVIGALTVLAARWLSGRRSDGGETAAREAADAGATGERERARAAARRLDEAAHREVYGHIAQGRPQEAVRAYRRHAGRGWQDSLLDVRALAQHPQVYSEPSPDDAPADPTAAARPVRAADGGRPAEAEADGAVRPTPADRTERPGEAPQPVEDGATAAEETADGPRRTGPTDRDELTTLTVPAGWTAEPAPEEPPFEVEVMRGDESVRLASRDLPPWLRDQLSAMVRDGNLESAAVQLSSHSSLSVPEAFELLRNIKDRREGRG